MPAAVLPDEAAFRQPVPHALIGRQVHRVPRLHVVRPIPRVDVADDAVDAELGRAVGIRQQHLAELSFAELAAPRLRECQEEPLITRQAVDDRRLAGARHVPPIGRLSHLQPSEIRQVFPHRQLRVDLEAGNGIAEALA
jgi:hypothetical protein